MTCCLREHLQCPAPPFTLSRSCRYHNHVIAYDETLLPHFLGMYRYKSAFGTSHLRFIVMNNLFATVNPIHHRYDIKVTCCCFTRIHHVRASTAHPHPALRAPPLAEPPAKLNAQKARNASKRQRYPPVAALVQVLTHALRRTSTWSVTTRCCTWTSLPPSNS